MTFIALHTAQNVKVNMKVKEYSIFVPNQMSDTPFCKQRSIKGSTRSTYSIH